MNSTKDISNTMLSTIDRDIKGIIFIQALTR